MKKALYLVLIASIVFANCSCTKKEEKKKEKQKVEKPVVEKKEEYVDNNPVTIGIYTRDTKGYNYIDSEIHLPWNQYKDIVVFKILPTHDNVINNWYMQDAFPSYWNKIENNTNYKIGFNLSYTTDEGDFSWNIIKPSDRFYEVFNYVQLYTYDDVTPTKGSWYDHLDDNEMTEGVLMTSIKLCASSYIDKIHSPMKLTVFTYDGDDDFDPVTKMYRGKSYHTIYIYKSN